MLPADAPLSAWLAWIETVSPREIDLGLDRVREVLNRLSLKQPSNCLLIGGTNGKGSSVAMADALLRAAGNRTGSYTSPHIFRFNERIRVDGKDAGDDEILSALRAIEDVRDDVPLTYFEYGTLAAMVVFARAELDVWILEVGLGGRLDATNSIEPSAALITNVALDHCEWLGADVESIAVEKAGIMRPGKPVVFASPDVPDAIHAQANAIGAELILSSLTEDPASIPQPGLNGAHQLINAAGVIALLRAAGFTEAIAPERIAAVLPHVTLAWRCDSIRYGGVEWIVDVAHNPAAAGVLARTLADSVDGGSTTAIAGMLDDKDVEGIVGPLANCVDRWITITADSPRAIDAAELARRIANECETACLIAPTPREAIDFATRCAEDRDRILVTGSFFAVSPVLRELDINGGTDRRVNRP